MDGSVLDPPRLPLLIASAASRPPLAAPVPTALFETESLFFTLEINFFAFLSIGDSHLSAVRKKHHQTG